MGTIADLLRADVDIRLPTCGPSIKIPTERLYAVGGTPREQHVPQKNKANTVGK